MPGKQRGEGWDSDAGYQCFPSEKIFYVSYTFLVSVVRDWEGWRWIGKGVKGGYEGKGGIL